MVSNQHVVTSWDVKTGKNVKWVSQLGSQSYGNPVVAGGQVYVGTNNELVRDPKRNVIYVLNFVSNSISVLDETSGALKGTIP